MASHRIHFLRFILEGYDGLAVLTTIDSQAGVVVLKYPPPVANELLALLSELAKSIKKQPEEMKSVE